MKRCPNCGGIYADNIQKCDECKIELVDSKDFDKANRKCRQEEWCKMDQYPSLSTKLLPIPQTAQLQVSCPKCGSTEYTAGKRGWKFTVGFLGSSKIIITCLKCGYQWKPGTD